MVELDGLELTASGELADVVRRVDASTFDIAAIDPYIKHRKAVASWRVDI